MNNYFTDHYSLMNNIDATNEESIKNWFDNGYKFYCMELNNLIDFEIANKRIVDLGCGIGGLINFLIGKGAKNICGVDSSQDQLNICEKYVTTNVLCLDVFDFLKRELTFDLIFAFDLIEHIKKEKLHALVELLHNRLANGGILIIRTPNMGSISGLHSRYIDLTHEIGFTEESIRQLFNGYNFKKISIRNAYIGKKRHLAIKTINWLIRKIYNIPTPKIVTTNLIVIIQK